VTRTVAILAGGLGTRVASITGGTLPKALLPIAGAPFIDHKLHEALRLGATRVVLLLGHGAEPIVEHVGTGSRFDLDIAVVVDGDRLLGTGGALKRAAAELGEQTWITYGDTLLSADLATAEADATALGCPAVMTVLHNEDRWEPSNTSVAGGLVVGYGKGEPPGTHAYIDYGYVLLPTAALLVVGDDVFDLADALRPLIAARRVAAFEVSERFHDIGTPEALAETDAWLRERVETP